MRTDRMIAVLLALSTLVVLGGCGSSGPTPGAPGGVSLTMAWPTGDGVQLDPAQPQVSLEVRFLDLNRNDVTELGVEWINAPDTNLRFDAIPSGDYIIQATTFGEPDLQGPPVGSVYVPLKVSPHLITYQPITASGLVHRVSVFPQPLRLREGETGLLTPTARDRDGTPIIVSMIDAFDWTVISGHGEIDIDEDGRVPVLSRIPFLSSFKGEVCHRNSHTCTELIILVTPHIVNPEP